MSDQLEFDRIVQEFRGSYHEGNLKLQPSTLTFKNKKTSKSEQIASKDIENAYWLKRSRGNCFKVVLKSGQIYRFDGFSETDFGKLDEFVNKVTSKRLEKTDLSVKGCNWGKANFVGDALSFDVDGRTAFEIPLRNVSNTSVAKNEAHLQFHQNEDAAVSMMEIRFHIPTTGADTEADAAEEFIQKVLAKADVISASDADAICTLTELNCVTPRGRYDVKFFTDFVDLHGKTFDYKISYEHIQRLFLLPHKDGRQMYFVIAIDPPMKQGNTRYPFLIVLFNIEEEISVELTISDKTKEKFGERIEKLDKTIKGPYHEVVSRICRTVLDKRITVPGNFTTASGAKCYPCSYKANAGFLYPLERGFIFVNKPPIHTPISEIATVSFDRSQQGTRSFDFEIETRNGIKYVFSGIEKTEQEKLAEFCKQKGINISKASTLQGKSSKFGELKDDEVDAYAERMKAEGAAAAADDDDDDEEDEDFNADEDSEDDDIEYDSDASTGTSSDDASGASDSDKKKKAKKSKSPSGKSPVKKSKKQASSEESEEEDDDDDDDDSEDEDESSEDEKKKKKKPAPKPKPKSEASKPKKVSPSKGSKGGEVKVPKSAEFVEDTDSD